MELTVPFSSYKYLRFLSVIAGLLGVAQSAAWLGMSVTALVSYFCHFDFNGVEANFGSILKLTMFQMYFRGDCTPNNFPAIDFTALSTVSLMPASTVYIWMWVVAVLSLLWFASSITLLTSVKKSSMEYVNVFIFIWVAITFVVAIIDLVLFILFIIDYEAIMSQSFSVSLNFAPVTNTILITAQNTAGMMASLALRGYFLWVINLCLCIYLFTQTFRVHDYNRTKVVNRNGQLNNGFNNNEFQGQTAFKNEPIQAFETQSHHPWFNYITTDIPRVQRQSTAPTHFAQPPQSKSGSSLDDNFQQRMTAATGSSQDRQSQDNNYDAKPQLRSAMRNSRYQ